MSNMVNEFCTTTEWDYVILDEGHIIKNPNTKISKSVTLLPSKHRLILTGGKAISKIKRF